MRRVIRSESQLRDLLDTLKAIPEHGWLISWDVYKPPRTLSQSRKIHAMINDLSDFTGIKDFKGYVKTMEFWPQESVVQFGKRTWKPKSEADLSKVEESAIIENLYALAALHLAPIGFEWSEPVQK